MQKAEGSQIGAFLEVCDRETSICLPSAFCLLPSLLCRLSSRHAGPAKDEAVSLNDVLSRWTVIATSGGGHRAAWFLE